MKKFLAVRAKSLTEAKKALSEIDCTVIKSSAERIDPAFRNLVEGFFARGMLYDIGGHGVFWLLVENDRSPEMYQAFSAVECAFTEDWFLQQAQKVRYLKGIAYCDKTSAWAELFPLKSQARKITVQFIQPDDVSIELVKDNVSVKDTERVSQNAPADKASLVIADDVVKKSNSVDMLALDLWPEQPQKSAVKRKPRSKIKRRRVVKEEQLDLFVVS